MRLCAKVSRGNIHRYLTEPFDNLLRRRNAEPHPEIGMPKNWADHIIDTRHERDGHVRRHARQNVGRQLLLDAHAGDLEIVILRAIIRDVERHNAARKRRRHVDMVFVLGDVYDSAIGSLCVGLAVRGVL